MRSFTIFLNALQIWCLSALGVGCAPANQDDPITVFAASSLQPVLEEVAEVYAITNGQRITLSLAGSSTLARQIEQGAPADLFISANRGWMDALAAKNLIVEATRVDVAANRLILISRAQNPAPIDLSGFSLATALGDQRLAMALVDAVPAGIYGKQALKHLGLWEAVAPSIAQTDNVRAALRLVVRGESPYAIVYATDLDPRVRVAAIFPDESHSPIRYPAAVMAGGNVEAAVDFLKFLQRDSTRELFHKHGFTTP
ncbi:MAG: molybdate ABC transporter substrate-binding protein [Pseudomonadota bacterium]